MQAQGCGFKSRPIHFADVAQSVEHSLGKREVAGALPAVGSIGSEASVAGRTPNPPSMGFNSSLARRVHMDALGSKIRLVGAACKVAWRGSTPRGASHSTKALDRRLNP